MKKHFMENISIKYFLRHTTYKFYRQTSSSQNQEHTMRYQEQFPTIWDTPLKTTAPTDQAATRKATAKPQPSPFKEAFLTIWDSTKSKTAS
ncbi:hypothetical protein NDQ72_07255 [Halomonas sp. KG2]|uniref:hypothetical protein n=1 Tax=Halomonas sp. KG2 TaxID=2951138 RepID=UPI0026482ECF|nr:hypothetical protein [Halomonas sp. KG2]WKD29730.1 hypothetical protein NDQ72_07255 [Halomonas sp. KG2]